MKRLFMIMSIMVMGVVGVMAQADKIVGNYFLDYEGKQSKVKVYKQGNKYFGKLYWTKDDKNKDGSKKLDVKNPDKSLRNVPVDQIVIVKNLVYNSKKDKWEDGKIYDPVHGMNWSLYVQFTDEKTLKLNAGPMGIKTMTWTKIQ